MNFDRETGILDAAGNVVIRQGDIELRAKAVRLNTETGEAKAFGRVVLKQGDQEWTGESLECNLKTKEGLTRGLRGNVGPLRVLSSETRRDPDGVFHLKGARVTTWPTEAVTGFASGWVRLRKSAKCFSTGCAGSGALSRRTMFRRE